MGCVGGTCTINAPKPIIELPYSVKNVPKFGKVVTYVDSNPYPAKGANVLLFTESGCDASAACSVPVASCRTRRPAP